MFQGRFTAEELTDYWDHDMEKETQHITASAPATKAQEAAGAASSAKKAAEAAERRTDPDDEKTYTFAEMEAKYEDEFSPEEIQDYWENDMEPVTVLGKGK